MYEEIKITLKFSVYHPGVFTQLNKMVSPVKHTLYFVLNVLLDSLLSHHQALT